MIFVDGVDIGDVGRRRAARPPHAQRRRDLHRRRDDRRAGRLARSPSPRSSSAACRSPTRPSELLEEIRGTVEASLERAAEEEIREVDLLQQMLHDDLAALVYERLRRRPMVLPVVVEV